jgi:hypothetical protein
VAGAAGNTLLRVAPNGQISMLALFPARLVEGPEPGSQILMDSVPTSVAVGPDGAYYVSELTGFPFPVGGARIYRVEPGETPQIYATVHLSYSGALPALGSAPEGVVAPPYLPHDRHSALLGHLP